MIGYNSTPGTCSGRWAMGHGSRSSSRRGIEKASSTDVRGPISEVTDVTFARGLGTAGTGRRLLWPIFDGEKQLPEG